MPNLVGKWQNSKVNRTGDLNKKQVADLVYVPWSLHRKAAHTIAAKLVNLVSALCTLLLTGGPLLGHGRLARQLSWRTLSNNVTGDGPDNMSTPAESWNHDTSAECDGIDQQTIPNYMVFIKVLSRIYSGFIISFVPVYQDLCSIYFPVFFPWKIFSEFLTFRFVWFLKFFVLSPRPTRPKKIAIHQAKSTESTLQDTSEIWDFSDFG